jgi:ketosteroid isomerase-like protein
MRSRLAVVACAAVAACSAAFSSAAQVSDDRAAIDRIRQAFEAAQNAGDANAAVRHFADDIVGMPPGGPPLRGPEAPGALRQYLEAFDVDVQYRSEEIVLVGEWAFDRGTFTETRTPKKGGASIEGAGSYLWVYRRVGGEWKQARLIWTVASGLQAPAPRPRSPARRSRFRGPQSYLRER